MEVCHEWTIEQLAQANEILDMKEEAEADHVREIRANSP